MVAGMRYMRIVTLAQAVDRRRLNRFPINPEAQTEVSPLDAAYNDLTAKFLARTITRDEYIEACAEVDRHHGIA